MTREELKAAIENGNYTNARINHPTGSQIYVNGECVTISMACKKAYYCIEVDLTEQQLDEIREAALVETIAETKKRLREYENQLTDLINKNNKQ